MSEREPPLETRLVSGPLRQRIAQKYIRTERKRERRGGRKEGQRPGRAIL